MESQNYYISELYKSKSLFFSRWVKMVGSNSRNIHDFDDLYQEIILKISQTYNRFNSISEVKAYTQISIKNRAIDITRKCTLESIDISEYKIADKTEDLSYLHVIWSNKMFKKVKCYEVSYLRFKQNYTYEEIAKELLIPLGTVKARIHRFKKVLLPTLIKYYDLTA